MFWLDLTCVHCTVLGVLQKDMYSIEMRQNAENHENKSFSNSSAITIIELHIYIYWPSISHSDLARQITHILDVDINFQWELRKEETNFIATADHSPVPSAAVGSVQFQDQSDKTASEWAELWVVCQAPDD